MHLWLPRTYANTSAPVAALFAILTKVGVYSIIRFFFIVFGGQAGALAFLAEPWMLPAALLTIVVGFVGLFAASSLRELAAYGVIGSTGTLLTATAVFDREALAAALYYLPHSTFSGALLFLVADLIIRRRGEWSDRLNTGPRFPGRGPTGAIFVLGAIALAGLPPLSGFIGKLLILTSTWGKTAAPWIWSVILGTTLLAVLGLVRAGSLLFWKSSEVEDARLTGRHARTEDYIAPSLLLVSLAALSLFALPVTRFMEATSAQLHAPRAYIEAVLRQEDQP
jgi:multicomponent K+:H+ antiporter subunit D